MNHQTTPIDRLASFAERVELKIKFARKFDELHGHTHPVESERLDEEAEDAIIELAQMMHGAKLSELVCEVLASPDGHILQDVFFESWICNGVFDSTIDPDHEWSEFATSFGDYVTAKHIWLEAKGQRGL